MNGIEIFNKVINSSLIDNRTFLKERGGYVPRFAVLAGKLKRQEHKRKRILESKDLTVPPILIMSVTKECNLTCRGCYDAALANEPDRQAGDEGELSIEELDRIIGEGVDAGVGLVFLAGGEPLLKKGILEVTEKYKDTLFVMFTNGLLINGAVMKRLGMIKNLIPVFSLEGNEASTDARRGDGVFKAVNRLMKDMDEKRLLFGASLTLTRDNYDEILAPSFLKGLEEAGCRTVFLIEYVPCEGDPELCLEESQKKDLLERMKSLPGEYAMLPVALPGNEEKYGGCLAAGRGFLHVSNSGRVEACPFAPFSDVNLRETSFLDALKSRLLGKIRENHHMLEEAEGGCTLFENREWVAGLAGK